MKTLHFISLNNCFVSIHVNVRFTHGYRDNVVDNDYAICFQIPALYKPQKRISYVARAQEQAGGSHYRF